MEDEKYTSCTVSDCFANDDGDCEALEYDPEPVTEPCSFYKTMDQIEEEENGIRSRKV